MQTVAVVSAVHSPLKPRNQRSNDTRKSLEIASTGANVISGSDQACLMNIAGMLDRLHKDGEIDRRIKVMHIAEILNCR